MVEVEVEVEELRLCLHFDTTTVERCLNLGREKKAVFLVTSVDLGGVEVVLALQYFDGDSTEIVWR